MNEETPTPINAPVLATADYYWREFLRVNFDKLILFVLILLMLAVGADERLIYLTVGILGGAVVHNRWQRNP